MKSKNGMFHVACELDELTRVLYYNLNFNKQ